MPPGVGVDSPDTREEAPLAIVPTLRMRPLFEFNAPSRALVTGGAGFIGAALCERLVAGGAEVHALDDLSAGWAGRLSEGDRLVLHSLDVGRTEDVARVLFEAGPFDVVYHLAARVGVRVVLEDPEAARRVNEDATAGLLAALQMLPRAERPRLFAASSSEVYRDAFAPLVEGAPVRSVRGVGRWAYAASKLRGEQFLDGARELWPRGAGPVHLRFFNVVGPGQDSAAGFVLPRFVEAARAGAALTVHGDGSSVRTFAHVDEVAETLARLACHPAVPEGPLNVGGVARASVLELARAVADASRESVEVRRVDPREELGPGFEDVRVRLPHLGRLGALGCGVPSMELGEIVADTYERHETSRAIDDGGAACASRAS